MKKIAFIFGFLSLSMSLSLSAFAGNGTGKVGRILVQKPHFVFFSVGEHNSAPACGMDLLDFTIDISTDLGQAQYAFIMMAKGLDETVVVTGDDSCSDWPDRESVNFMFIPD